MTVFPCATAVDPRVNTVPDNCEVAIDVADVKRVPVSSGNVIVLSEDATAEGAFIATAGGRRSGHVNDGLGGRGGNGALGGEGSAGGKGG